MAREFKVEFIDGHNYEFFVHDDDQVEIASAVEPMPMHHYTASLDLIKSLVGIMREMNLDGVEVTKVS